MNEPITAIAFDGDDTLWHNERIFLLTQERFACLLRPYYAAPDLDERLLATEGRNLVHFGYGVKGFVLSMIETAIEVTGGRVPATVIAEIIAAGKEMRGHPVELLPGVAATIDALQPRYRLLLITKGDLFDQESKIARSGLVDRFAAVEIVAEKDAASYRRILQRHAIGPKEFLMVGNSVRSDVLPVLAIGARAVHVPYHTTWVHERAEIPPDRADRVRSLEGIGDLPDLLAQFDCREMGAR